MPPASTCARAATSPAAWRRAEAGSAPWIGLSISSPSAISHVFHMGLPLDLLDHRDAASEVGSGLSLNRASGGARRGQHLDMDLDPMSRRDPAITRVQTEVVYGGPPVVVGHRGS